MSKWNAKRDIKIGGTVYVCSMTGPEAVSVVEAYPVSVKLRTVDGLVFSADYGDVYPSASKADAAPRAVLS